MSTGLIVGILMVGVLLIVAALRKGSSAAKNKPRRIQSFATSMAPSSVLKALIRFAQQSGYKIEFLDEAKGNIVLSDSASLTSYGFFYPVFLSSQREDQTLVEVGIKSKVWQVGPSSAVITTSALTA